MEGERGELSWTSRSGKPESGERVTMTLLGETAKQVELPKMDRVDRAEGLAAFAEAIKTQTQPESSGRENIGSLALMQSMIESARTGKPVQVPKLKV
jgi:predicted dehydrogenase